MKLLEYLNTTQVTTKGLAEAVGVTPNTIRYWAQGKVEPSVTNAIRMHRATLGAVDIFSWLDEVDEDA